MKRVLIVVDMQNDFITGSLRSQAAQEIVPKITKAIDEFDGYVIATMDTHGGAKYYLDTQEGHNLPVPHCEHNTEGWKLHPDIEAAISSTEVDPFMPKTYTKHEFGCVPMARTLKFNSHKLKEIILVGVCTDICVISNALLLKSYLPEVKIIVDADCCAGTTPERHEAALEVMKSCQIVVVNGVNYRSIPDNDIKKTPEMIEENGSFPF